MYLLFNTIMFKLVAIAICLAATVNTQIAIPRDEDRPTRYYTDLGVAEEYQKPQYYKTNRRSDRIPAYQYDESASDEDYYSAQLKKTQEPDYQYQPATTPTHKDYEQILKNTHLARLRATSKKQPPTAQPQVEQYLKEVNPTTQTLVNSQTIYRRPSNYLRFNEQQQRQQQIANLKHQQQHQQQEQSEETQRAALKQPAYRYVLQSELQQQKLYPEYQQQQQYEPELQVPQETPKTKPHFNLVAYQNALLAQQKLLAQQEAAPEESKLYQNAPKKQKGIKQKAQVPRPQHQHDYYTQTEQPEQRYQYHPEQAPARYHHRRPLYQNPEYQPEEVEQREEYQVPTRTNKHKTRYNLPPKYQHQVEEQVDDYQDDEPQYRRPVKYQPQSEEQYRRPIPRKQKTKYANPAEEHREPKHYQSEDLTQYQTAQHLRYLQPGRHIFHYVPEERPAAARPRPQQYPEESRQYLQYYYPDLVNQASVELPVRHRPNTARPLIAAYQPENSRYHRNLDRPTSYVEGI